ncbi:MAG: ABC transporter permease subunit [Clostridia bacterium]|nr:ABC transporter permease subunit [Clostridia bacterium]
MLQTLSFYQITLNSFLNVFWGILFGTLGACLLAMLTYKVKLIRELFLPLMSVIKATPVASFIILAFFFIGSSRTPSFITFLMVFPVVWTNLDEGLRKIDNGLDEVAQVYRFSSFDKLRYLTLPSVQPYFASACRSALGLAWKAGVAAEIITMPPETIGSMIGDAKTYIMTEEMFAWTLTVILLSLLIEFGVGRLLGLLEGRRRVGKEEN